MVIYCLKILKGRSLLLLLSLDIILTLRKSKTDMKEHIRCCYYRNKKKKKIKIIVQKDSKTTIKHLSYKENQNLTY